MLKANNQKTDNYKARKKNEKLFGYTILLFGTALILVNCEKETREMKSEEIDLKIVESEEIDPGTPVSVTNISTEEIPDFLELIGTGTEKTSKPGFTPTPLGDVVMESVIKAVDTLGNTNYSFLLLPETDSPDSFFNLVVSTSETGTPNIAILEYRMDEGFANA